MKIVHYESKSKAKELALAAFNKMESALQTEIKTLITKYGELRHSVRDLIGSYERMLSIMN